MHQASRGQSLKREKSTDITISFLEILTLTQLETADVPNEGSGARVLIITQVHCSVSQNQYQWPGLYLSFPILDSKID